MKQNKKKINFVLICLFINRVISVGVFYFLFESYEKTVLVDRTVFLILDIIFTISVDVCSFLLAEEIYKEE